MPSHSLNFDLLFDTFDQFYGAAVAYVPTLLTALVVLGFGLAVALLLKIVVLRVADASSALMRRMSVSNDSWQVRLPWPLSTIIANIIYWLVVVFFLAVVSRIVGLPGIAEWIAVAAGYLPRIGAAAIVLLAGYALASIARDAISQLGEGPANQGGAALFARTSFVLINLVAVLAALRHLGIDLVLVQSLLLIMAGAACGGIAFAFGMGASGSLDNVIAGYYLRRAYRVGQRLRIGGIEGEIITISPTAVLLDTARGRALIPARKFNDDISLLLGQEDRKDDE